MMSIYAGRERTKLSYKILSAFIAFTFVFTSVLPPGYAQTGTGLGLSLLNLPAPGTMVTPSAAFVPVLLKGMTIHPENPLQFDFIIDSGNTNFKEDQIKAESDRLVKYFLASMTIPKDDLWVNLSPYESDRIIPDELGKTELGRDMLAQDYILKQLTASLMYPEKEFGKEFWNRVYQKIREEYGTIRPPKAGETSSNSQGELDWAEIPVDTFNKVWILPETATVYEHGQTVYIVEAKLKVMLDADYLAASGQRIVDRDKSLTANRLTLSAEIIREIILPEIEKEVNEGQNFASLRQIYHSLILAKWYKETIKNSLLSKVYVDKKLINGIRLEDGQLKGEDGSIIDSQSSIVDQIYNQYMEAYKKGVFNYIKEDYDRLSNETIPRKYFSGGIKGDVKIDRTASNSGIETSTVGKNYQLAMEVSPQKDGAAIPKESASPVTMDDLLNVPAGLIGALEENSRILSVKAGKIFDIGFGDYWSQIQGFAAGHPQISAVSGLLVAGITITGGLYYYWSRYTVSGNIHRLNNDNWVMRKDAAIKLGELEDTSAVEPLIPMLKDSSPSVRSAAAEALGKLGDKRAIEFLIPMLKDSDVHSVVAEALGRLGATKEQMGEGYLNALRSPDPSVRSAAAEALGKLGDKMAIEFLIPMLKDSDSSVRRSVVSNLSKLGAGKEQIVDGYVKVLDSFPQGVHRGNVEVLREAVTALRKLGDKESIAPLNRRLESLEEELANTAVIYSVTSSFDEADSESSSDDEDFESSSPITPQEARAMIKGKLAPEQHHLIDDIHVQLAMAYEGDFEVVYHPGPPESIEIVRAKAVDQSSSPVVEQQGQGARVMGQGIASDEIRNTSDEVGGIDMNTIDLDRLPAGRQGQGGGVDIQFDPAQLQELIDAGIDGFTPVIINITPLPSVLPLLGLEPAIKEEPLELSSSG